MNKGILVAVIAASMALLGCSTISGLTYSPGPVQPKIVRSTQIGSKWEMRHISLEVGQGEELPILLKLADGDKVDGYFYLEKGSNIDFQIMANSMVYKPSNPNPGSTKGMTSDRFSFTATQAQGISYSLTFRNPVSAAEKESKVTIFLEVIYPSTGSIFTRLDNK